jgi:hypothetical protein
LEKWRAFLSIAHERVEWARFVILSICLACCRRDCCVSYPVSRDSGEFLYSKGRFEHAARIHPGSGGGVCGHGN